MSEIFTGKRGARVALSLTLLLGACSRDNDTERDAIRSTTTMTYMLPEPQPTTTTLALSTPENTAQQGARDVDDVPFDAQNCAKFKKTNLYIGEALIIKDPTGVESYALENKGLSRTGELTAMFEHQDQVNITRRYIYDYNFGPHNFAYADGSTAHVEVQQSIADIDSIDVSGWTCN